MQKILIACVALTALLAGCGPKLDLPEAFVSVDESDLGPYEVRGVSADGVVIALRESKSPANGTLEFWAEAVKNELVTNRNYTAQASETITTHSNLEGRLLTFKAVRSGHPFTYMTAVYVEQTVTDWLLKRRTVLVAEAGGKAKAIEPHLEKVKESFRSVR